MPPPTRPSYENTYAKDFIMDAPWRVADAQTAIPLTIILKDCDADDVRQLHWIRCWDVTGGGSTLLWSHSFGDERIGDDPTEFDCWTYITTVTEGHPSLPNGTPLTPANLGHAAGDVIRLQVSIYYRDDIFNYTETRNLRVLVGGGAYPWPADWYGGDTHTHTMYTNNVAESGAPIPAQRRAAAALGLHWLVTTDHSCDMDETGDGDWSYATPAWEYTLQTPSGAQTFYRYTSSYGTTWDAIGADATEFQGTDLRIVRGAEVNLASIDGDSPDKTLHCLFIDNVYVHSPWSGAIGERPVFPSLPDGLVQIQGAGLAFAAHPLSDLGTEFGGMDYAVNGALWGDEDLDTALLYEGLPGTRGIQHASDPLLDRTRRIHGTTSMRACDPTVPIRRNCSRGSMPGTDCSGIASSTGPPRDASCPRGGCSSPAAATRTATSTTRLVSPSTAMRRTTPSARCRRSPTCRAPTAPETSRPPSRLLDAVRLGRTVVTDGPFVEIGLDRDDDGDWYESRRPPDRRPRKREPERHPPAPDPVGVAAGVRSDHLRTRPRGKHGGDIAADRIRPIGFRARIRRRDDDRPPRIWIQRTPLLPGRMPHRRRRRRPSGIRQSDLDRLQRHGGRRRGTVRGFPRAGPCHARALRVDDAHRVHAPARRRRGLRDLRCRRAAGSAASRADSSLAAGIHGIAWDGLDDRGAPAASGVYHGVLTVDGVRSTEKLHLLR